MNQEAGLTWKVKATEEYAAWFTALIKEDLGSATQVAQAVAALREEGPASSTRQKTRSDKRAEAHPTGLGNP